MDRPIIPLSALRAFEAAARHLTLSKAAVELCVTQAALSHQIRNLKDRLGVAPFRRVPRELVLTEEGAALAPVLTRSLDAISDTLDRFSGDRYHEALHVGVVGTFATDCSFRGWRATRRPIWEVDLRVFTNNNRVSIPGKGLDLAIRFGDGSWHGLDACRIMDAPLTPMCAPTLTSSIIHPEDLGTQRLLRSYRASEWERWFTSLGLNCPPLRDPMLDSPWHWPTWHRKVTELPCFPPHSSHTGQRQAALFACSIICPLNLLGLRKT
ncbi:LysR family transcriptional regulator [Paracoccus chinensis]|uniref:LysR family transcriptional regulator, regulator of gene expression of beta-lactamase n=1 Tax=Paracoccus chinensis TaxID=525640 RepID=A0A1G9K1J1_9RHOB|nr:LysR family transcriptional regulator [Paracoccus chinensis]SDL43244.1 LysR family transcriptional regulator, regulator of gene expression of beta-lactamase [Paracoccus chinensis]